MLTVEELLNVDKDNANELAGRIGKNDLPELVELLSEKDDKLRYAALLLLKSRSARCGDVYPFWDVFRGKLKSDNSYQRSIGMMLIAENARWDIENRLDGMLEDYFALFRDEKPITIRQSIQALYSIIPYKPVLTGAIATALMSISIQDVKETMRKSILLDILEILVQIRKQKADETIDSYIFNALSGGLLDRKSKSMIEAMLRQSA
ncbi:MAG TPA: hypothetical protein VHT96_11700 [Clostridia bacterium]|nr:hypothetical protein [Clostridia bacterium]